MKLSEAAIHYEKCMADLGHDCGDCPMLRHLRLDFGDKHDEHGGIRWTIQACSVMALLDKFLKNK